MTFFVPRRPSPGIDAGRDLQAAAGSARLDGTRQKALDIGRGRLVATAGAFVAAFAVVGLRLVDVAVLDPDPARPVPHAEARTEALVMDRADIADRNGVILATSLPTVALYAKAAEILDVAEAATRLASVLPELDRREVMARLASGKGFVYLKRNLTPRQHYDVNALGIPGLYFEKGERRVYPQGNLVAHIVGMTDVDNKGVAGIERRFEAVLHGERTPLTLSLDVRLQTVVRNELARTVRDHRAEGGIGLMMDVDTGELLAAVSLPDFDPNEPPPATALAMFNRVTKGVYEMGSTFKLFNTAAALDSGRADLSSSFDARGPLKIGGYEIHDSHGQNRWLTVPEILIHSSNIGSARMALAMGGTIQRALLERIGMTAPPPIELPEVAAPLVPDPWRDISVATVAYGHGISVTPLHLLAGVAALVGGGEYRQPTLLAHREGEPVSGQRVVKPQTSEQMRRLMRLAVTEGTGKHADVPGYLVGGKTGTAEKAGNGSYRKKAVLSSFVAAFPMDAPKLAVLVMIDEPEANAVSHGQITGGWVAAPVVARIVAQTAPLMGLLPRREPAAGPKGIATSSRSGELAAVE
ncbi:MAG: penicillin-binding protein 2 [Magnetospirillum sp.]|nr:penicillin-binding protein 2 [Magnetospirillum sp.]